MMTAHGSSKCAALASKRLAVGLLGLLAACSPKSIVQPNSTLHWADGSFTYRLVVGSLAQPAMLVRIDSSKNKEASVPVDLRPEKRQWRLIPRAVTVLADSHHAINAPPAEDERYSLSVHVLTDPKTRQPMPRQYVVVASRDGASMGGGYTNAQGILRLTVQPVAYTHGAVVKDSQKVVFEAPPELRKQLGRDSIVIWKRTYVDEKRVYRVPEQLIVEPDHEPYVIALDSSKRSQAFRVYRRSQNKPLPVQQGILSFPAKEGPSLWLQYRDSTQTLLREGRVGQ